MYDPNEPQIPLIPSGYSVTVTYAHVMYDDGDGESGPHLADLGNAPVYVEVRNSAQGEQIAAWVFDTNVGWTIVFPEGKEDVLRRYFAENGDPRDGGEAEYQAIAGYLHEDLGVI